jgi:hypothetical protein
VAIVQISRITQRKGLQENLPQLAGAELGWSVDQRRLYIGNGTIEEGAPAIGNTEVLTEFSNILELGSTYVYQGQAAGYIVQTGATPGSPVSQSLQSRLDSTAIVTDFGATGDGVTDDTEAINRALFQLFCRQQNPQIRRSLFFPAGVYLVRETILIPPYAKLYGEGAFSSVIKLDTSLDVSTLNSYVARTADSLQQYGPNIGVGGATTPQDVDISDMGFQNLEETDIFLVDQAESVSFNNVSFVGYLNTTDLSNPITRENNAGLRFNSTAGLICNNIRVNNCQFTNTTYGINTAEPVRSVSVNGCNFNTLYQGVVWGGTVDPVLGGPIGCSVMNSQFNVIYDSGILVDNTTKNMTGYNMFLDVGNHFGGVSGTPYAPVIRFTDTNNVSLGDMFSRSDGAAQSYPRIALDDFPNIAIDNGKTLMLGTYQRNAGITDTLLNNTTNGILFTIDAGDTTTFSMNYSITRGAATRLGTFTVIGTSGLSTTDDFTEDASVGVTFSESVVGSTISILYTTTNTGQSANLNYSIVKLT